MPELTKTFRIDYDSPIDGRNYSGNFIIQKLSVGGVMEMGVRKAQLTAGFSYNPITGKGIGMVQETLAEMVSMCEASIIDGPKWFGDVLDLVDDTPLRLVFEEVKSFEDSFRKLIADRNGRRAKGRNTEAGESEREGEGSSSVERQERQSNVTEKMVGEKVPLVTKVG